MWSEKTASKLLKWGLIVGVLFQLLLSFFCVDKQYIPENIGIKMYFANIGFMIFISVQYFLASKGQHRKQLIYGMIFSAIYFIFREF